MRISAVHNPGSDPMVANPTPLSFAFQPALRADVSRAGEALRPRHFNRKRQIQRHIETRIES